MFNRHVAVVTLIFVCFRLVAFVDHCNLLDISLRISHKYPNRLQSIDNITRRTFYIDFFVIFAV